MRSNDLIKKAKLIRDSNGERKAVQLDYATWDQLLGFLEDIEDLEEIHKVRKSDEESVAWEQFMEELSMRSDARITEAINKVCSEVDTSLDPVLYAMQWASLPKEDW